MLEDLSSIFNYVDFNIKDFPTFINNKKILITGSSGFIGGYMVTFLCWLKEKVFT